jgi:hypothetical protein
MFVWDGDVAIDCIIADCKNKAGYRTTLLCHTHQARLRKYGDPMMITRGINGEGHINKLGYKEIWVDGIKKLEHRYVMEQFLDRQLFQHENVHHKNGQRSDNSIDNLELWSTSQPSGQRVEDKIIWAREFLKQYDAKVIL